MPRPPFQQIGDHLHHPFLSVPEGCTAAFGMGVIVVEGGEGREVEGEQRERGIVLVRG